MGRRTNASVANKNEDLIKRTCKDLSINSYTTYFTPLIQSEEKAVDDALKKNIMQDVLINNEGIISLQNYLNRFSNLKLGSNVDIKMTLSPLFSVQHQSWKLSVSEFDLGKRMIKVRMDNQFRLLKQCEKRISKQFRKTDNLPFTLEILPSSIVTHFYRENLKADPLKSLDVLFPSNSKKVTKGKRQKINSFFNQSLKSNDRQVQAIEHIVGFSSYPFPYILFGPPGTGKSSTVAEAIKQVHYLPKLTRILVCAPSNVAVDVLTDKILNNVQPSSVLRIVAFRHEERYLSKTGAFRDSLQIGCFKKEIIPWLLNNADKSVIFLCTSVMGYALSKILGKIFTHVFYDEAGFSSEPECLLAIKPHLDKAFIVLSGDHYQLGPVVLSQDTFGLTISLMERLMTCDPCYMVRNDGAFNPKFVTKLVHNYRSDFRLLKISSDLFYDGELVAKVSPCLAITRARERLGYRFPMVFIDVVGQMTRPRKSTSFFNDVEVEIVQKIVNKLITYEDISQRSFGVISPYRPQYMQLESILHYCPRIEFGSPELFQGREKDIIIISTARCSSGSNNLGFLNNFKRFNVAITRARYLCVVVGDGSLLGKDPIWAELIRYIKGNGGFITWNTETNRGVNNLCDSLNRMKIVK